MTILAAMTSTEKTLLTMYDPTAAQAGLGAKIEALINSNNKLHAALALAGGDEILHTPALAVGSTAQRVAHGALTYTVTGLGYSLAANAAGVAPAGLTAIPANKFAGWRLEVGVNGTVDYVEVTNDAAGYGTIALAYAAILAAPATDDHAIVGYAIVGTTAVVTPNTTPLTGIVTFYTPNTLFHKQASAIV